MRRDTFVANVVLLVLTICLFLGLLAFAGTAVLNADEVVPERDPLPATIYLRPNQSITVACVGEVDEILLAKGATAVEVTCRTWVNGADDAE